MFQDFLGYMVFFFIIISFRGLRFLFMLVGFLGLGLGVFGVQGSRV